ncbi:NADPH-dependent FMN reductase [Mycolicibacterium thermoresistibile]
MSTYTVGYFVGSLSSTSINRILAQALIKLAPDDLSFVEIPIRDLLLYSQDYDENYPPEGRALKEAIDAVDAVLFVTPEFNRSIPGALKNAIDWASRPWGQNSFDHMPAAVIGASPGADRYRRGPAEPASGAELLQRPPDDLPGGLHHVPAGYLRRGRFGVRRVDR